jgi:hypothetical protein
MMVQETDHTFYVPQQPCATLDDLTPIETYGICSTAFFIVFVAV